MKDDDHMTRVDRLVQQARQSPAVLEVMAKGESQIYAALMELDEALAALQEDPADLMAQICRALVLRGTLANLTDNAFSKRDQAMVRQESGT